MRKFIFFSIVAAIAVAMTFVSCGEKKSAQNTEELLTEGFTLVTTPQGAKGIKKGDAILVIPTDTYKDITVDNGMFLAKTGDGYSLLDPETGYSVVDADAIVWKDFFFEGRRGENFIVYIPAYKTQFAAQAYAVKGAYAIATFGGKITIWQDGKQLIEPTGDYSKVVVLPDGKLLVLNGKAWGMATVTKDKLIQPGRAVSPKDLKKYQAMKGFDKDATVMILE